MKCERCHSSCATCQGGLDTDCLTCNENDMYLKGKCVNCQTLGTDLLPYFDIKGASCTEKCGKGLRFTSSLQCDDGNQVDGDGCSSECKVEENFECSGGTPTSPDKCIDASPLTFKLTELYEEEYLY